MFSHFDDPRKILVFRTGSIGDNICAMPALHAIRRRFLGAQIHILTNAGSRNLVSLSHLLSDGAYDHMIDYLGQGPSQLIKLLRKEKYDLVVELPQDQASLLNQLRNMLFFRLAGIGSGFGWQVNTIFSFRQEQEKNLKFISERQRLLDMLMRQGIPTGDERFELRITDADRAIVDSLLRHNNNGKRLIAVVPGAKRSQNRYPLDRFKNISSWLIDKGYQVVIVGGPEDEERGDSLLTSAEIHNFCGKLTPVQSAAMLEKCFITISNDTGPMHLSYAVGTPVIGLFSSRDFQNKWFPPASSIALRNNNVHCSLCFSETCGDNICMKGISVEEVKNAFLRLEAALQ